MAKQITITDKKSHASMVLESADIHLSAPAVVMLKLPRGRVKSLKRDGNTLIVTTQDGEVIVLRDFFLEENAVHSDLVVMDDGGLWLADLSETGWNPAAEFTKIDSIDPLLLHDSPDLGVLPYVIGALAVGGITAGLSHLGDGGDDPAKPKVGIDTISQNDNGTLHVAGRTEPANQVTVTFPDGTTVTVTAGSDGTYAADSNSVQTSGGVDAVAKDPRSGDTSDTAHSDWVDATPPKAPTLVVTPNEDGGLTVEGQAEPGGNVTVTFPDGSTHEVVADEDGHYSVTTDVPQTSGKVEVDVVDRPRRRR